MPEAKHPLRAVRETTPSRRVPNKTMTRRELAEEAVAWLWEATGHRYALDANYVAKIERGAVKAPSDHYRAAFRAVLGVASDADIGFGADDSALPQVVAVPGSLPADAIEGVLLSAADESTQFLEWVESSNVGELTIEQMHSEVQRIVRSYLKQPTLPLFGRTKALRDRAFNLLAGHQNPRQSRELYAAAGWALTTLAWMSVDLGRPDAGEDHARAAWACAERADHNLLRAWVRATQHTASFWQKDYGSAAEYAADGLRYSGIGTAELYLSSALAMDLARVGDMERGSAALTHAQRVAETAERVDGELEGPFTCPLDRAGSVWATAQLALGDTDAALTYANRSVSLFEATPATHRNLGSERMARMLQVEAHLRRGDLDGAEHTLTPVLTTEPAHRVRPLLLRVTEISDLAERVCAAADPIANRVRDAIAEFQRETVTKEITA